MQLIDDLIGSNVTNTVNNATTMKSMNIKHTKKLFIGTSAICMYNKTPSSLAFGIGKDIWQ